MNINELLKKPTTPLHWQESRGGVDASGKPFNCILHCSMTAADAIDFQRWSVAYTEGFAEALGMSESVLLREFIESHWAEVECLERGE